MTLKRRATRYVMNLAAEVTTSTRQFTATTKDISVGGCCIASPYSLEEGSELRCDLYLVIDGVEDADLPPLATLASVQWTADTEEAGSSERHIAGLQFRQMTDAQKEWLAGILKRAQADEK